MRRALFSFLILAAAVPADELRVLTYNVRYPANGDGENVWERRRGIFIDSIRRLNPDLIGTQELFKEQGDYLVEQLPEYAWFGKSRKGDTPDEMMGVFYRRSVLKLIASGHFWLSETPDTVGSSSWNMSLPRMVTWAEFETVKGRQRFYYYNTHFAHRREDEDARSRSAEVILERFAKLPAKIPFLLTGDFNTGPDSRAHEVFTGAGLKDAWTGAKQRTGPEGTFHGFRGKPGPQRIDWILHRGPWRTVRAETSDWNQDGRYPSDHFPVLAVFEIR